MGEYSIFIIYLSITAFDGRNTGHTAGFNSKIRYGRRPDVRRGLFELTSLNGTGSRLGSEKESFRPGINYNVEGYLGPSSSIVLAL